MSLALCFVGCERGCLRDWLEERGALSGTPAVPRAAAPLASLDCPAGLARCEDGIVEASAAAIVRPDCQGAACACPWESIGRCATACVADGVEVVVPTELARVQLCRDGLPPTARDDDAKFGTVAREAAPDAMDRGPCDDGERFVCDRGVLYACSAVAGDEARLRPIAECVWGCVGDAEALDDEGVRPLAAAALLCRRGP
jgi:hypothetical protein